MEEIDKKCQGKNNEEIDNNIILENTTNETAEEVAEAGSEIQENNNETSKQKFNADTEVKEYKNDTEREENGSSQNSNLTKVSIEKDVPNKEQQVIILSDIIVKRSVTPVPLPQSQSQKKLVNLPWIYFLGRGVT